MGKNKMIIIISYMVGAFILPEYYFNYLKGITLTRNSSRYINHYSGNYVNSFRSNTRIRSFDRNSKVNF